MSQEILSVILKESRQSDRIIGHCETVVIHLAKEIIKDFKGKCRKDHLKGKELKICYQKQFNILRKIVLLTERKAKFSFYKLKFKIQLLN